MSSAVHGQRTEVLPLQPSSKKTAGDRPVGSKVALRAEASYREFHSPAYCIGE